MASDSWQHTCTVVKHELRWCRACRMVVPHTHDGFDFCPKVTKVMGVHGLLATKDYPDIAAGLCVLLSGFALVMHVERLHGIHNSAAVYSQP